MATSNNNLKPVVMGSAALRAQKIPPDITFCHHLSAPAEKKKTLTRGSRDSDIKAGIKVSVMAITMCIVSI
jgi:hypothetical protein